MMSVLRLGALLAFFVAAVQPGFSETTSLPADQRLLTAVKSADDERVAAMMSGDRARLDAILSNDLHYGHSNGAVDTKESLIEKLAGRRTTYESISYQVREFLPSSAGTVLMHGRMILRVRNGDQPLVLDLSYLAVWREEQGRWKFLAWQSSPNPKPQSG